MNHINGQILLIGPTGSIAEGGTGTSFYQIIFLNSDLSYEKGPVPLHTYAKTS